MYIKRLKFIMGGRLYGLAVLSLLAIISLPLAASAAGPQTTRSFSGAGVVMVPTQLPKVTVTPQTAIEVPLGYELDKKTLNSLKNNPVISPKGGVQPTLRQDPAVKAKAPGPFAPGLLTTFEGRDNGGQPDGFLHRPPDPTMAAGINHIGTVVNATIDFYNKAGTLVLQQSLSSWFAAQTPPGTGPFDPKIVYDAQSGHWMIIALASDFTSQAVYLLSVSQTSDPTGLWWNYSINSVSTLGGNAWGDYEDIGFDSKAPGSVYISSNQFAFAGGFFTTAQVLTLNKFELYTGSALTLFKSVGLKNVDGTSAFSIRTARTQGTPSDEFMINSKSGGGSTVTLWKFVRVPPAVPTITKTSVNIGSYSLAPNAKQPGCTKTLDTIDNRIFNAVQKNGKLYAGFTEAHNWGSGIVAAARLLSIDTATSAAVINETYGSDGLYYWFPAVTVDGSGNMVSVFARSGTGEFAGIRYSGRLTTDTATQPSGLLKVGASCITGDRWGDYFGISVDPVDNANVWIFGEWAKDVVGVGSIWDWGTWVGEVSFTVAPPPPALTLTLTPDVASVARGANLGYTINAVNTTGVTQCIDYWEDVTLPSGSTFPPSGTLFGPKHVCLGAGTTKNVHLTQGVPLSAPVGAYSYNGSVGTFPAADTSSSFNFNVTAVNPVTKNPARSWTLIENGFRK